MRLRCRGAAPRPAHVKERGMRGAKRPRPFLVGSLSAPRLRRYVQAPSPRLPPLPRAVHDGRQRWTRAFQPGRGADEPLRWSVTPAAKREATLSQMRPQVRFAVLLRRRSPALSCQDGPRSRIPHGAGMDASVLEVLSAGIVRGKIGRLLVRARQLGAKSRRCALLG